MMRICNFAADLTRACKSCLGIKDMVGSVYREKALKKMGIDAIVKKVKSGEKINDPLPLNSKKRYM
jgi:hypothetical protein